MNLIDIALDTNDLATPRLFYVRLMGLPVLLHSDTHLSLLISNTRLTFRKVRGIVAPNHIRINVLRDLLTVFMRKYDLGCRSTQTLEEKSTYRLERQLDRYHFYDPMGNLIEFIPQMHLTSECPIVNPHVVRQLEGRSVLLCA